MVSDLRQLDPAVLERYMGRPAMMAFRAHHGLDSDLLQYANGAVAL
jgi:hypothetical protein